MSRCLALLLAMLALLLPGTASAASLQPLAATAVHALVKPPAHGEKIIALWALDCAYCEPNLRALAALQRKNPRQIQLITVSTDSMTLAAQIEARLTAMKVNVYPSMAYASEAVERMNFLLDPSWGGETPRVLVIRHDGSRLGISGELTSAQLNKLP